MLWGIKSRIIGKGNPISAVINRSTKIITCITQIKTGSGNLMDTLNTLQKLNI